MPVLMSFLVSLPYIVVEAITEFLPVSSTAHLLLVEKIMASITQSSFFDFNLFCVLSQLAAIFAVVIVFFSPVCQHKKTWGKLLLAVIPTAVLGVALHSVIKKYLQDASPLTGWMLIIFGIVFSLADYFWEKKKPTGDVSDHHLTTSWVKEVNQTPWYKMIAIGLGQSLALIPGVSRSGACIYTARALGFSKVAATALSFIIAVPVIAGAAGLDLVKSSYKTYQFYHEEDGFCDGTQAEIDSFLNECHCIPSRMLMPCPENILPQKTSTWFVTITTTVVTFVISLFVCKKLLKILASKPFWYFAVWRLVIGIVWLFLFWPNT